MLILLSPAKSLNTKDLPKANKVSKPLFLEDTSELADRLKKLSPSGLKKLMSINNKLADLNYDRYQEWHSDYNKKEAFPAAFLFMGEVYRGLGARDLNGHELNRAQKSIRILSGFHGVLRPLDLIMPYRLEMGTKLNNSRGKDLYDFWQEKLTEHIKEELSGQKRPLIVNLASAEYSKAIDFSALDCRIITPGFKEWRKGKWANIQFNMKRARGLLARYIIKENCKTAVSLKRFNYEEYAFNKDLSAGDNFVFSRS